MRNVNETKIRSIQALESEAVTTIVMDCAGVAIGTLSCYSTLLRSASQQWRSLAPNGLHQTLHCSLRLAWLATLDLTGGKFFGHHGQPLASRPRKAEAGRYSERNMSSFCGRVPLIRPRRTAPHIVHARSLAQAGPRAAGRGRGRGRH